MTSVVIEPYLKEERGKYINICFNEIISENESVYIKFHFFTQDGNVWRYGTTFHGNEKLCQRFNVFVALTHRHSSELEIDFLRNHLKKGNIDELEIEVLEEYDGHSVYNGTFNDL